MKKYILKFIVKILSSRWQYLRISLFASFSDNSYTGSPSINIPLQTMGKGIIKFGKNNILGISPSPFFYNGTIYIESRSKEAEIIIGDNVYINNNFVMICDRSKIEIGNNTLIGTCVEIYDSDFHELHPDKRNSGKHICEKVLIGENVFIASNVKILKGVSIGKNSVIANGSLVISDVPENSVYGGIPAKFIKKLD